LFQQSKYSEYTQRPEIDIYLWALFYFPAFWQKTTQEGRKAQLRLYRLALFHKLDVIENVRFGLEMYGGFAAFLFLPFQSNSPRFYKIVYKRVRDPELRRASETELIYIKKCANWNSRTLCILIDSGVSVSSAVCYGPPKSAEKEKRAQRQTSLDSL